MRPGRCLPAHLPARRQATLGVVGVADASTCRQQWGSGLACFMHLQPLALCGETSVVARLADMAPGILGVDCGWRVVDARQPWVWWTLPLSLPADASSRV